MWLASLGSNGSGSLRNGTIIQKRMVINADLKSTAERIHTPRKLTSQHAPHELVEIPHARECSILGHL